MDKPAAHQLREFCEDIHATLAALSAPIRLEILVHILRQPSSVSRLAEELELEITHVSKHLRILADATLVTFTQIKRERFYESTSAVLLLDEQSATGTRVAWLLIKAASKHSPLHLRIQVPHNLPTCAFAQPPYRETTPPVDCRPPALEDWRRLPIEGTIPGTHYSPVGRRTPSSAYQ